jgi:uncharacterized protein YceH (UPF0502 family)
MKSRWLQRFALLFLGFVLGSIVAFSMAPAKASSEEVRLSRLESDLARLESEVNQLSSQIRSLDRVGDRPRPNPVEVPPIAQPDTSISSNDPMFDRLATLVIELKQRMDGFEERLVELER